VASHDKFLISKEHCHFDRREKSLVLGRDDNKNIGLADKGSDYPEWKDLSDGWFEISPSGRDDKKMNVEMTK
jgi:hypothetical protein